MIANIIRISPPKAQRAPRACNGLRSRSKNFIEGGIIESFGTDGDFNVGISNNKKLEEFITEKRKSGVYISVLGFGTGNLKDDKLEIITKTATVNTPTLTR